MKTIINIKADKEVKERAQKIAKELGLPLSTVINASLKQFIRNKEVLFSSAPRMTPELEAIIGRAQLDFRTRKNISRVFADDGEMDDYLDSL